MSKHSYSIELRLGLFQLWKVSVSVYGVNFKLYNLLLWNNLKTKFYIEKLCDFFLVSGLLFEYIIHSKYIVLVIYYSNLKQLNMSSTFFNNFKKNSDILHYWTKVPTYCIYYKQRNWLNFAFLITQYIKFSFNYNKLSFKTIFKKLKPSLINYLTKKIIYSNTTGIKIYSITGIKIYCQGRLGGARNPLSQIVKETVGSLPLPKLNGYLDYAQDTTLTKYGIYSIRIWIFYL